MLMIEPEPCSTIRGMAYLQPRKTPRTLTAMTWSHVATSRVDDRVVGLGHDPGVVVQDVHPTVRAKEREQFGKPIASFQLVQAMIADMVLRTDASRMLVWRAGWLKDTGQPNTLETSIAKLYSTEAAVHCSNTAIQVHGGAGYVDDHPVERYFRDVRVTTLYEGTSQIQQLIIGRAMTGINALVPA